MHRFPTPIALRRPVLSMCGAMALTTLAACRPATVEVRAAVWDPSGGCVYQGPVTLDADYWWAYRPGSGDDGDEMPYVVQSDGGFCLYFGTMYGRTVEQRFAGRYDPCFTRDEGDPPLTGPLCGDGLPDATCTTSREIDICPGLEE